MTVWRVETTDSGGNDAEWSVMTGPDADILSIGRFRLRTFGHPPVGRGGPDEARNEINTPNSERSVAALAGPLRAVGRPSGTVVVSDHFGGTWVFDAHQAEIGAIGLHPQSRQIVTGSASGTAGEGRRLTTDVTADGAVWNMFQRKKVADLRGHTAGILSACFSPDGKFVATGSKDNTARVWDAATGQQLQLLAGHLFWVRAVAFSPDGKRLATGGMDGAVKVWDPATGSELLTLPAPADGVTQVGFTPDGTKLVAAGLDGTIRVYDATPTDPAVPHPAR